jgi:hypothetical protein
MPFKDVTLAFYVDWIVVSTFTSGIPFISFNCENIPSGFA